MEESLDEKDFEKSNENNEDSNEAKFIKVEENVNDIKKEMNKTEKVKKKIGKKESL